MSVKKYISFFIAFPLLPIVVTGCCGPSIDLDDYGYLRETPCETVRYFQLAMELGAWEKAAACVFSEEETIGAFELWVASDINSKELGNVSLQEILLGASYFEVVEAVRQNGRRLFDPPPREIETAASVTVMVLSRPRRNSDMRYDLVLEKRKDLWIINLDKTVSRNLP